MEVSSKGRNINIDFILQYVDMGEKIVLTSLYYGSERLLCKSKKDLLIEF